ncbi:MAG: CAAX prenyl protease-related protein [Bryobacteraceae bacterium]
MSIAPSGKPALAGMPWLPYILPFAAFIAFLALEHLLPVDPVLVYPIRAVTVTILLALFSRHVIDFHARHVAGSVALGIAVFVIWVAPDVLWPAWRAHWLFQNSVLGSIRTDVPPVLKSSLLFIVFRTYGCVIMVPILEELFWRGWLARWLIDADDFRRVPLGAYTMGSFWIGSILFASEHGPYWEVGLLAGIAYNWWMRRTRSLGDAILTHAVTNGCLSAYVLAADKWHYWF